MNNRSTSSSDDDGIWLPKVESKISQRSEIVQDVLSRRLSFIEKWSVLLFMILLVALVSVTHFIYYPDIIETDANIIAFNAPKEIIPFEGGRLVKLFTRNNDIVKKGELIGWIESTAKHSEVLNLFEQLDDATELLRRGNVEQVSSIFAHRFYNLGELQLQYGTFLESLQVFRDYVTNGFYSRKRKHLTTEIQSLNRKKDNIEAQKVLLTEELRLVEESYLMNERLFEKKGLSADEYRNAKRKLLAQKMDIPQLDLALLSNEELRSTKLNDVEQIDHDIFKQRYIFEQQILALKSFIDNWKKRFLLQSPVEGTVSFLTPVQENLYLQQGKVIGFVSPIDNKFYAQTYLKQQNLSKIKIGLKVQIRIDAYPYQENGSIDGILEYISNVATESGFLATIKLANGLKTNFNKEIPFKNGLTARALVITQDMRLSYRLYSGLVKLTTVDSKQ